MMETFTWLPEQKAISEEVQYRVLSARFGDGYEQSAGAGLNPRRSGWSLMFVGIEEKMGPIQEFLDRHGEGRAFLWTPPGWSEAMVVQCRGYTKTHRGGPVWQLSLGFEQGFRP